jgi:arginine decarboxylase
VLGTVALTEVAITNRTSITTSTQLRTPVVDALQDYGTKGTVPFSTPGHKLGAAIDRDLHDLLGNQFFAADVWLNTADHDHTLHLAEGLASQTWGADRSYFLVNGSSSGNQAFLLAMVAPGDEVIVGRDLHQSLLMGLILTGARPIYVAPRLHPSLHLGLGLATADVVAVLDAHPAAKLLVLTSPTY